MSTPVDPNNSFGDSPLLPSGLLPSGFPPIDPGYLDPSYYNDPWVTSGAFNPPPSPEDMQAIHQMIAQFANVTLNNLEQIHKENEQRRKEENPDDTT